jgi:ribosome maturation factor RimP
VTREETRDRLIEMIEPVAERLGYELVHLNYVTGKHGLLHLFIDKEGGITVEDCASFSRAVSEMLENNDPISHAYTLEVSSPGLERPLSKKEHFIRFQGKKVKVRTGVPLDGSSKFSGTLLSAGVEKIVIVKEDGSKVELPYTLITRANLWLPGPDKMRGPK